MSFNGSMFSSFSSLARTRRSTETEAKASLFSFDFTKKSRKKGRQLSSSPGVKARNSSNVSDGLENYDEDPDLITAVSRRENRRLKDSSHLSLTHDLDDDDVAGKTSPVKKPKSKRSKPKDENQNMPKASTSKSKKSSKSSKSKSSTAKSKSPSGVKQSRRKRLIIEDSDDTEKSPEIFSPRHVTVSMSTESSIVSENASGSIVTDVLEGNSNDQVGVEESSKPDVPGLQMQPFVKLDRLDLDMGNAIVIELDQSGREMEMECSQTEANQIPEDGEDENGLILTNFVIDFRHAEYMRLQNAEITKNELSVERWVTTNTPSYVDYDMVTPGNNEYPGVVISTFFNESHMRSGYIRIEPQTVKPPDMFSDCTWTIWVIRGSVTVKSSGGFLTTEDGVNVLYGQVLKQGACLHVPNHTFFTLENWTMEEALLGYSSIKVLNDPGSETGD